MRIFLQQVDIQVKTECSRSPGGFQGVAGSIRTVQFIECLIQATVIFHIRLGNQGCNRLEGRKHCLLLSLGMPHQDFVEEAETFYGSLETFLSLCCVQGSGIDTLQVIPEGI
jgi:hypothetical protein